MAKLTPELLVSCLKMRIPVLDFVDQIQGDELLQSEETQHQVLQTLNFILNHNPFYVKRFLGEYMRVLEREGELDEGIYELYCDPRILGAVENPATKEDFLEYNVGEDLTIQIRETPRVISGAGTTGLRTWEAALYLLDYLNRGQSPVSLKGKKIVELGAGTGLVSLSLMKNHSKHQFSSVVVTDGNTSLLPTFQETVKLNSLNINAEVKTEQLIWGSDSFASSNSESVNEAASEALSDESSRILFLPKADIVLGADVTYDALVVPLLCETIEEFFGQGTKMVLIAATIRNLDTISAWEKELRQRFNWSVIEKLQDPHLSEILCYFRKGTPEIRIYQILSSALS